MPIKRRRVAPEEQVPATSPTPPARTSDRSWAVFYSPTITIDVGDKDDRESFQVAKDVLTKNSPVFSAMLEGKELGLARQYVTALTVTSPCSESMLEPWLRFNLAGCSIVLPLQLVFYAILTGQYKEAAEGRLRAPQFSPHAFCFFLRVLHIVLLDSSAPGQMLYPEDTDVVEWIELV